MDMTARFIPADCFTCTHWTMKNTLMRLHHHVEMQPGAVVHTDVAKINFTPLGGG